MKPIHGLVLCLGALVIACGPGSDPPYEEAGGEAAESSSSADWQLLDDSLFIAEIEPWPPRAGAATLKAEATMDDWEQMFSGTVSYRLAATADGFEPWQPLPRVRDDADGSVYFEAPVTLSEGTVFVQFRLLDSGDTDFTELTDWSIEVQ